jgi:hypothetical protein
LLTLFVCDLFCLIKAGFMKVLNQKGGRVYTNDKGKLVFRPTTKRL